jgi:hypothetical protein
VTGNIRSRRVTTLTVGVAVALSAMVLALGASGQATDSFYPLVDAVMARMHGARSTRSSRSMP